MKAVLLLTLVCALMAFQVDDEGLEAATCLYRYQGIVWNIGELIGETDYKVINPNDVNTYVYFNVCKKITNSWGQDTYASLYSNGKWRSLTNSGNSPQVYALDDENLRLYYEYTGTETCTK